MDNENGHQGKSKRRDDETVLARTATSYGAKNRQKTSLNPLSTKTVKISKLNFLKNQNQIAVLFHFWLQILAFFQAAERRCVCRRTAMFSLWCGAVSAVERPCSLSGLCRANSWSNCTERFVVQGWGRGVSHRFKEGATCMWATQSH